MSRVSALSLLFLVLIFILAFPAYGQFGQNKVRYRSYDFKVLKTQHFDIYYYPEEKAAAEQAGRMAERWYTRLSNLFHWNLSSRQPVIFYDTGTAFRGTTVVPDYIGESTGGLTEPLQRRIVMPLAGPLAETDHVLGHELVHAFQYDMTSRGRGVFGGGMSGINSLPLWFIEGMAEYLSLGRINPLTAMWMRDAVLRNQVPKLRDLDNPKYFPYRWGQAFWAYVGGKYGDDKIGPLLQTAASGGIGGALKAELHVSVDELSEEWAQALKAQYGPVLKVTNPPSQHGQVFFSKKHGGTELNVSPALSPDGKHIIFFSEKSLFAINLFLADAQTGKIEKQITHVAVDPHFTSLDFINSAGAWSPDGKKFVFGTVAGGNAELDIYDMDRGSVADKFKIKQVGELLSPSWSPKGNEIVFSAMVGGLTDLYVYDVNSRNLRRLTDDEYAESQPVWSPDGKTIAFVTDRFTSNLSDLSFGQYRLALMDVASGKISEVTNFSGKQINPQWSPDGQSLYFISDHNGISNIYRVALADHQVYQVTNIQTGVAGITSLSPALTVAAQSGELVYCAFNDGNYELVKIPSGAGAEGNAPSTALANLSAGVLPPTSASNETIDTYLNSPREGLVNTADFKITQYHASLHLDYIAPPEIGLGTGSYGTFVAGGTGFHFSDLLGYHSLTVAAQTSLTTETGNFVNSLTGIVSYVNQRHRWSWGLTGGQVPYLTGGYGEGIGVVNGQPALIQQSITAWQVNRIANGTIAYPFSRAQRIEFTTGYHNIAFSAQARTQAISPTGQLLLDQKEDIPAPPDLNLSTSDAALVYDTSIFGGTSPIDGQRYRLQAGVSAGSLTYSTISLDYRRYVPITRYLSLAGRAMHYGRYGGDSADPRLEDVFLGYPSLVRGYSSASFSAAECGQSVGATTTCPVFDRLIGNRMLVGNGELRLETLGPLGVLKTPYLPPVETALFYDVGLAWSNLQKADFLGGPRDPVSSYGASLRFNIFGIAIGELSYVHPNDRPLKNWMWEFSFLPGF